MKDIYRLLNDGLTLAKTSDPAREEIVSSTDHGTRTKYVPKARVFNAAAKRERFILLTGDLARTGFAVSPELADIAPPPVLCGELRLSVGGISLESCMTSASFMPHGTQWICTLPEGSAQVLACISSEHSAFVRVRIFDRTGNPVSAEIKGSFGGARTGTRPYGGAWIGENDPVIPADMQNDGNGCCKTVTKDGNRTLCHWRLVTDAKHSVSLGDIAQFSVNTAEVYFALDTKTSPSDTREKLEREKSAGEAFFQNRLRSCETQIPDGTIAAGFRWGVVNHAYTHCGPAWLEGGQWYSCYWTNNYQISAAVALGQDAEARRALKFFGTRPDGYNCIDAAGNTAWLYDAQSEENPVGYEGLPYYLYELDEYVQATGDADLVREVFPNAVRMLEYLLRVRSSKDGLIGWRHECNAFLYQADSLSLPGSAASPSIMIGAMLKRFAGLARLIGENKKAAEYEARGEKILRLARERLWNDEDGAYDSHIDNEGCRHRARYYTDYVFPVLYGEEDAESKAKSLYRLKQNLMFQAAESGETLLRVGELKPTMFGNDNAMPTQASETARALFSVGDSSAACRLLHGTARAATTLTDEPGSFPERTDDNGKGEFHYMFGNAAASYVYAYVGGLFGLSRRAGGKELHLSPRFPDEWKEASVRLPYAKVDYGKDGEKRIFRVQTRAEKAVLSLAVPPCGDIFVQADGADVVSVKHKTGVDCRMAEIELKTVGEESFVCTVVPVNMRAEKFVLPDRFETGGENSYVRRKLVFSKEKDYTVLSAEERILPKGSVRFRCRYKRCFELSCSARAASSKEKSVLSVTVYAGGEPIRIVHGADAAKDISESFCFLRPSLRVIRAEYEWRTENEVLACGTADVPVEIDDSFERERLDARSVRVDMDMIANADYMSVKSCWRDSSCYPILPFPHAKDGLLETAAGTFSVKPSARAGEHCICAAVAEKGFLHKETQRPLPTGLKSGIDIKIGRRVSNAGILAATELASRLCKSAAAVLRFCYADGTEEAIPLRGGKHLSSLVHNYASESRAEVRLDGMQNYDSASVFWFKTDETKELEKISIEVLSYDCQIALLGITLL